MLRKISAYLLLFISVSALKADIIDDILKNTANAQQHQALTEAKKGNFDEALNLIDTVLKKTNNNPSVISDKIVILSMAGKKDEVIALYKSLPPKYKSPDYLKTIAAKAFYDTGAYQDVIKTLEPEIKKFSKNTAAMEILARAYIANGDMKKAQMLLKTTGEKAEWLKTQEAELKHKKGVELARAGKHKEADNLLSEAYILDKNNHEIIFDKTVNLSWGGRHSAALKTYNTIPQNVEIPEYVLIEVAKSFSAKSRYDKSDEICNKILAKDKENPEARKILIGNLLEQKKLKEAENMMAAGSPQANDAALAESMRKKAALLAREGKTDEAEKLFQEAYAKDSKNNAILFDRIVNFSWANRHKEAIKLYESLPQNIEVPQYVRKEIERSYKESNAYEKSAKFYAEEAKKTDTGKDAAIAEVSLMATAGEFEKARKFINSRMEKYPEEKTFLSKILFYELQKKAVAEARAGRIEIAKPLMEEALKESNNSPAVLCDYITILAWNNMPKEALEQYAKLPKDYECPDYVTDAAAKAFRDTGNFEKSAGLYYKILEKNTADRKALFGYMLSKIQAGKAADAVQIAERNNKLSGKFDASSAGLLGKAYLAADMPKEAETEFKKALSADPKNLDALVGSSKILLKNKDWAGAGNFADMALAQAPDDIEALYCKAEAAEGKGDLPSAFRCYEKLTSMPAGERAEEDKYRVLSSMGGTGLALSMLKQKKELPRQELMTKLMGDEAVARISRLEGKKASELLERNLNEASPSPYKDFTFRTRYDKFIANRQLLEMQKIIDDYEKLLSEKVTPPYWVTQAAADAYLYKRKPRTSLKIYRIAEKQMEEMGLGQYPDNFDLQMAIYYNLLELENFSEATKQLDNLEKNIRALRVQNGIFSENWDYMTVKIEKAWLLIFQDKLPEAEKYTAEILEKSPYNTNIRTAQAYLHFYRGWPRKALEDFQIIAAIDPDDRAARVGLCYALDANDEGEKARAMAKDLSIEYPADLAVQKVNRAFEIDDSRKETIAFQYDQTQGQTGDVMLSQRFEQPIFPHRKVYVETVWKHVTKGGLEDDTVPETKEIFRNITGFEWRLDRDFTIFGAGSLDYQAQHPGGEGGLQYTPDDHWTFKAYYNSYSLNAPGWIYLDNGYAQEYYVETKYRLSEDFEAEFKFDQMFLSDHNIMSTWSARQDKILTSSADWKTHLAMEESLTTATKTDVAYYSPQYNAFVYFVPYVEHLWFRRYDFAVSDKFYLAPGLQFEKSYGTAFAGYIKYENEINFTDSISLVTGITGTSQNYDGDRSYGFSVFSTFVFHF